MKLMVKSKAKRLLTDIVNIIYRYIHASLTQTVIKEYKSIMFLEDNLNCIVYKTKKHVHCLNYREIRFAEVCKYIHHYRTSNVVAGLPKRYFY
jgi:hypothetical protein